MSGEGGHFWGFTACDDVALRCEDGELWSYARLDAAIAMHPLASSARGLHVLEMANDARDVVTFLAGLRHGHAIVLAGDRERAAALARQFSAEAIWSGGTAKPTGSRSPELHADLALMLSTSGSTGSGKCVRLSYANLAANARSIAEYLGLDAHERAITSLPLHYSYGLSVLTSHLHAGASITLTGESVASTAFADLATRDAITSLAGVPHSYDLIDRSGFRERAPGTLKTLTQAGGRLDPATVERFRSWIAARGGRMFVMYGQTEATARIAYVPPDQLAERQGCIGVAIPGGKLELMGEDGASIDVDNRQGELVYSGPNVMLGYATTPEDLKRGRDLESLATGDIAVRERGLFRIVGRQSRFTKLFGLRIDLDELEGQLSAAGVEAAVAGDDQRLAIAAPAAARSAVTEVIDKLGLPPGIVHHVEVDALPRLASGKIDYPAVLRGAVPHQQTSGDVLDLFRRTFPGADVSDADCFAELGGDSLTYVSFSIELETLLGHLPDDWDTKPVVALRNLAKEPVTQKGGLKAIPSDAVLRTLGIASVVGNHASNAPVGGGVAALILLVGYSLARFQRKQLSRGNWRPFLNRWAMTILTPYLILLVGYLLVVRPVPISLFTLTANYDQSLRGFVLPFWFISAYSQLLLLIVGSAAMLPAVRSAIARAPFGAGLTVLGASWLLLALASVFDAAPLGRGLVEVLPLAALGWCAALADTARRKAIAIIATLALGALEAVIRVRQDWNDIVLLLHIGWWTLPALILIARPMLSVPKGLWRPIAAVSAASFTIYLTHTLPIWLAARATHDEPGLWAAIVALVAGVAFHVLSQQVAARWRVRFS